MLTQTPSIALSRELRTIIAVAVANVPYWIVRTPTEVVTTRDQVRRTTSKPGTAGSSATTLEALRELWRLRGLRGVVDTLYGSFYSNLAYALPADIIKFVACEQLRFVCCVCRLSPCINHTDKTRIYHRRCCTKSVS